MLVVLLMRIVGPRRRCPVIGKWSYLRWRTVPAAIRRHGPRRSPMTATGRKANAGSWTIVGIGNSVLRGWLGHLGRWLRQTLRRRIRAWSDVVEVWRWCSTSDRSMSMLFAILHHLLLSRADLPRSWGGSDSLTLIVRIWGLRLRLRVLNLCQPASPVLIGAGWGGTRPLGHWRRTRSPPLWTGRSSNTSRLVELWVHILWNGSAMLVRHACGLAIIPQKL